MVAAIGVALFCEFAYCGGEILRAMVVAVAVVIPGALVYLARYYWGTPVACAAMIVPAIWAYRVECVLPYAGGGAAMAFVALPLYGAPVALVLGGMVGYVFRSKHAG
jgi:hypothetical protein